MKRATQATVELLDNEAVLAQGMDTARDLWNEVRHGVIGFNRWLAKCRGHDSLAGRLPPYPGNFGIQSVMKDSDNYRNLSDRCASYTVKDFDIAMRSWFSNLKSNPKARPPRKSYQGRTLTFEVGRNAKPVGNFEYRLTVLGGHIGERHAIVRVHLRPGIKMEQVKLIRIKNDRIRGWYRASLILDRPDVAVDDDRAERFAALDLGLINLGALAFDNGETILYNGRALLDVLRLGEKRAAKCKPSGWSPGKSRLPPSQRQRSYKRKAANTLDLAIHNFTTSVVHECMQRGVTTLAAGKLTGIRANKDFGKSGNQKFHRWPHLKIRQQLKYKGEEVGIEVVEISEAYTSKTCCDCGVLDGDSRVHRGLYSCRHCGLVINADVNGALNMLKKVSPDATAFGVGGSLPAPPSPTERASGIGKPTRIIANHPHFVARFDLRNWSVIMIPQVVSEHSLQHYI